MRAIKKLEQQINSLNKAVENLKQEKYYRWKANYNEDYFYIKSNGDIGKATDQNFMWDRSRYDIGNYFKTQEEAENILEKQKTFMQLRDIAIKLNAGEDIDEQKSRSKYYISAINDISIGGQLRLIQNKDEWSPLEQHKIYCLNEHFLEIAIEEIGEKYFNIAKERIENTEV